MSEVTPPSLTTNEQIKIPSGLGYRQGTEISGQKIAFVFNAGGIGDYINWISAIHYAIDTNPHISGVIFAPEYFYELAKLWLDGYSKRFTLHMTRDFTKEKLLDEHAAIIPNVAQYANACGFHLFHLGFVYFTQSSEVPTDYNCLPAINGDEVDISHFNLPADRTYAVVTTAATADVRRLSADQINAMTKFLLAEGIIPVFLGRKQLTNDYSATESEGIETDGVIDLREKTTLPEAACIMARAKFVFGLDNGLLHLASCSKVPVVWIFTSVDPKLRLPPRRHGTKSIALVPDEKLGCRFCNTRMRFILGHEFKNCIYKDNLCVTSIDMKVITEQIKERVINAN